MTTDEVEAEFAAKLGDLSTYDSFMDYNAAFLTSDLDSYATAFDEDGVNYLPISFIDQNVSYYGVMVLVPESQMILEVVQEDSATTTKIAAHPKLLKMNEPRHPHKSLQRATAEITAKLAARKASSDSSSSDDIMVALTISRATSNMNAINAFYSNGMQTTTTLSYSDDDVVKNCYLWEKQGATVDVCFTQRSDNATSTDFKVVDFENMLKTVHANIVAGQDTSSYGCNNKWMDNHYAVDNTGVGNDYIVNFIDHHDGLYIYCDGLGLHYITDPTGWGIQLDLLFTHQPAVCPSSSSSSSLFSQQKKASCPCTGMKKCGEGGGLS